jgi:hypothetical protein
MNANAMVLKLTAAFGIALALVSFSAGAAKPGGADPCATSANLDFPAFTYARPSGTTQQIVVADASGQCVRPLSLVTEGFSAQLSSFRYPIEGVANKGRVIWLEGTQVVGVDFTVSGTAVSVEPRRTIISGVDCCALELSQDGRHVYVSTTEHTLEKISVAVPTSRALIKTFADGGFVDGSVKSVNGIDTVLYVEELRWSGGRELIRIDLQTFQSTVLPTSGIARFGAAADPSSNLIVYTDYVLGSNNCNLLQIADGTTGQVISYGQPRYGVGSTWHAGKILTNGYTPPKAGGRCSGTDTITEIDPTSSAERKLTRGFYPDGR